MMATFKEGFLWGGAVAAFLVYFPFIRVYDQKLVKEEQEAQCCLNIIFEIIFQKIISKKQQKSFSIKMDFATFLFY